MAALFKTLEQEREHAAKEFFMGRRGGSESV